MHYFPGTCGEIHRIRLDSELIDAAWLDRKLRRIDLDSERYCAMLAVRDELGDVLEARGMAQVLRTLEREHLARPIAHGGRPVTWRLTWAGEGALEAAETWLSLPPQPKPSHRAQVIQMEHVAGKSA